MKIAPGQHLIFDADDTLWENNIYFDDAFAAFCGHLSHSRLTPDEIRAELDQIEIENNKVHGYGALNFARNLRQCYGHLAERQVTPADLDHVAGLAHRILETPMELIDGVAETLAELRERHELTMFTKGAIPEQTAKIERSGLAPLFAHCAIVKEKHRDAYLELADVRAFRHSATWMIGNSPKSDVNPALRAGLNAVHIPHERTWTLEREEIVPGNGKLLVIANFRELLRVF
jgi:putative hydrolase of the HAD superfamily